MLTLALVFVLLQQNPKSAAPPDYEKGASLLHACEAALRVLDTTASDIKDADVALGEHCLGYIDGFKDGGNLENWSICVGDARLLSLAREYVAYMDHNPKLLDKPRNEGVLLALRYNHPCSMEPRKK